MTTINQNRKLHYLFSLETSLTERRKENQQYEDRLRQTEDKHNKLRDKLEKIRGHNYLTAGQWIAAGALPTEYELVEWISDTKAQAINAYQLNNYSFNEPAWAISYFGSLEPLRREYYQSKRI